MFVVCVVEVRADWPAFCEIAGVRYWNHAIAGCPKCTIPHSMMISAEQIPSMTVDGSNWPAFTSEQYLATIKKCKIVACLGSSLDYWCSFSLLLFSTIGSDGVLLTMAAVGACSGSRSSWAIASPWGG